MIEPGTTTSEFIIDVNTVAFFRRRSSCKLWAMAQASLFAMLNLRVIGRWETRGRFFSPTCVGPTRPFYSASPSPFHFTVFTFSSPSASGSSAFQCAAPLPPFPLHAAGGGKRGGTSKPAAGGAAGGAAGTEGPAARGAARAAAGLAARAAARPAAGPAARAAVAPAGAAGGAAARHQRRPLPRSIFIFFICIQIFFKKK